MKFFIDIETIPPNTDKFYSYQEMSDEDFRKLSLQAEYGKILCIGLILEIDGCEALRGVVGWGKIPDLFYFNEAETLRDFWNLLRGFNTKRDLIIGHNIIDFALPFIYKRSRIIKVKPSVKLSFARYKSSPIYDTMREWSMWNLKEKGISLSRLAQILELGINKTERIAGNKIYQEYKEGNHRKIADHCMQNVEITKAVYERISN
jgi:3'-5' exonuclease